MKAKTAMNLKLNWLGLYVSDFKASLHYYTSVLGIATRVAKSDFALFRTTGMTFEMFAGGTGPLQDQFWGHGQAFRPGIMVDDLPGLTTELRSKGVQFTGEQTQTEPGEQVELLAPELLRWTLIHAPDNPNSTRLNRPHLGLVELKVLHQTEQRDFYAEFLGLQPEEQADGGIMFRQEPGNPLLVLKSGGEQAPPLQVHQGELYLPPPHLLGFETSDIEQAASQLKSLGVPILIDATRRDWGGIEMILSDPDGNPIQVVEYVRR